MISPGYYSQECNAHKQCKDPVKYCHMFLCVDCLKENVACTQNGQCCPQSECVYGRCKTGATPGQAGERNLDLHNHPYIVATRSYPAFYLCRLSALAFGFNIPFLCFNFVFHVRLQVESPFLSISRNYFNCSRSERFHFDLSRLIHLSLLFNFPPFYPIYML